MHEQKTCHACCIDYVYTTPMYRLAKHLPPTTEGRRVEDFSPEQVITSHRQIRDDHEAFHLLGSNPMLTNAQRSYYDLLDW